MLHCLQVVEVLQVLLLLWKMHLLLGGGLCAADHHSNSCHTVHRLYQVGKGAQVGGAR